MKEGVKESKSSSSRSFGSQDNLCDIIINFEDTEGEREGGGRKERRGGEEEREEREEREGRRRD